jgi:4-amino-4-deoxy-L-arabinose transferase-like glycosyltransferase
VVVSQHGNQAMLQFETFHPSLISMNKTSTQKISNWFWMTIIGLICFRLWIMTSIDLIDDEAYHWTWSQNLSWSYFDHPGMVAWMIYPFVSLFGHSPFVIRLPGFLMFLGIVSVVFQMAKSLFDLRTAQYSAILLFLIPLWGFASLGTLPDVPLAFFWILAAYVFWQSIRDDHQCRWSVRSTWLTLGVVMGLGVNSKLACCLIGLGMGLFLLISPKHRYQLKTPWPYLAALVTIAMMLPIFYWNHLNDWATFKYQFARRHTEDAGANWPRFIQFLSIQAIFMSPGIYIGMLSAIYLGLKKRVESKYLYLVSLALPALIIFYYSALMSAHKPHWSGPSYLLLLPLTVYLFFRLKQFYRWIIGIAVVALLLPFQLLYFPLVTPIIPKIAQTQSSDFPQNWNPTWDFSNEFYGWKFAAQKIIELKQIPGNENLLVGAQRYELISQLTWALTHGPDGHKSESNDEPKVWIASSESNQFFYIQRNLITNQIGKDFVIVNNDKYPRDPRDLARFDSCEKNAYPFYREEFLARTFFIYICKNFQGFKH